MKKSPPYTITVHSIINRAEGIIGPGLLRGRSGSPELAVKAVRRHLQGCLRAGPSNVAHIVHEDTGEDFGWWFLSARSSVRGRSMTVRLCPVQHKGQALIVQAEPADAIERIERLRAGEVARA